MRSEERIKNAKKDLETKLARLIRIQHMFEQSEYKDDEDVKNKILDAFLGEEQRESEYAYE